MVDIMDQETFDNLYQCNFDPASKNGSGIGISVMKVRPQGAQILGSKTYSNGAGNPFNWLSAMLDSQRYLVDDTKPFEVFNIPKDERSYSRSSNEHTFKRRLDAEKFRIAAEIEYVKKSGKFDNQPKELVFEYLERLENELETIEERHPEWVI